MFLPEIIFSLLKGISIGTSVCLVSFILDRTYCNKSFQQVYNTFPKLYVDGITANLYNMMIIGPITFSIVNVNFIHHNTTNIQVIYVLQLVLVHNCLYYVAHYYMHKPFLYSIHKFHHTYDNILLPSFGNAVSSKEFFIAYLSPFIIGAKLLNPNEPTFILSISIISFFNMIIHCNELENIKWFKIFVSPKQHIQHHKVKNKNYAAPLINIDYILSKMYVV